MNDAEIDIVAAELAKIGGTSWYPGRENGPILRVVTERYRDRARAAIAALDRYRASQQSSATPDEPSHEEDEASAILSAPIGGIRAGATVVYRPPGDRRAYPCTIEKISDGFVYLVPKFKTQIGWIPASEMTMHPTFVKDLQSEEEVAEEDSPDQ